MDIRDNKGSSDDLLGKELELYVLRSDYQRAISRLDQTRIEVNNLRDELARRPRDPIDVETLRNDTEFLSAKLKDTREQICASVERLASLEAERNAAEQRVELSVGQLAQLRAELDDNHQMLESIRQDLAVVESERDALRSEVATRVATLISAYAERDTLNGQVERLRELLSASENQVSLQRSEINAVGQVLLEQKERLAELESLATERDNLKTECERLGAEVLQVRAELNHCREAASSQCNLEKRLVGLLEDVEQRLQEKLKGQHNEQLDAIRDRSDRLSAGLLSKFAMIASEVNTLQRLREGGLQAPSNHEYLRLLYLDLLEKALTGDLYEDAPMNPWSSFEYDPEVRLRGWDWPTHAQTMIGRARLKNVRDLVEFVFRRNIEGDFLEAGVWRGGACIYMRGLLAAFNVRSRKVWVADSFQGLPEANLDLYPADAGDRHHVFQELRVSLEEVKANFARYNLLDEQVAFLPGWFKDTLRKAPVERLAILRLDSDMYGSTIETLEALYDKVVPGGFVIIDDYILPRCRQAVHEFRRKYNIGELIREVDGAAIYWQVRPGKRRDDAKARTVKSMKRAKRGR